jgi:hypothetical protein
MIMNAQTYKVYGSCESSDNAETNLTATEVVKHIYQDDGHGYRLEPRMDETGEQQLQSSLGLEWDVYFTKPGKRYGEKSGLSAYGETEDEAEAEFLASAWNETRWDDSKWFIEAE